jgi:hypothetical protein
MIVMILVTPKAGAQHEFLFNKLASALFAKHVSPTNVTPQSVAIITHLSVLILVTPKAGAMHELFLKELASAFLVKASSIVRKYETEAEVADRDLMLATSGITITKFFTVETPSVCVAQGPVLYNF